MGDSRIPGPIGRSGKVQDLNDGTMTRRLSPHPGPIGRGPTLTSSSVATAHEPASIVNQLLKQLRNATSGEELQRIVVAILGPQCFSAGVIVGIGVDIVLSAKDLIGLVVTFALADLHDLRTGEISLWRYAEPTTVSRLLSAKLAGVFFGDVLREAAVERDALLKELADALQNPKALFEGMADGVIESYKKDWQEFNVQMNAGTLEGRFRAGMILGELLVDVLGLLTGVVGAAKAGVKLTTKLPRLVKYARSIKLKPRGRGMSRTTSRTRRGGGVPSEAPAEQVTAKPQTRSRPKAKGEKLDEGVGKKQRKMAEDRPHQGGTPSKRLKVDSSKVDQKRIDELSWNHEQKLTDRREGLGGARYEQASGKKLRPGDTEGVDFYDPDPVSLKGPLANKKTGELLPNIDDKKVDGLSKSVVKDVQQNTAAKNVVVDTAGMTPTQKAQLKQKIAEGLANKPGLPGKEITFLE